MVRGINLNFMLCPLCSVMIEDYGHVFVGCYVTKYIWKKVCKWIDLHFPLFTNITEIMEWMDGMSSSMLKKSKVEVIVITIIWVIWSYQNSEVFKTYNIRMNHIFESIVIHSFSWLSSRNSKNSITWSQWMQNPIVFDTL